MNESLLIQNLTTNMGNGETMPIGNIANTSFSNQLTNYANNKAITYEDILTDNTLVIPANPTTGLLQKNLYYSDQSKSVIPSLLSFVEIAQNNQVPNNRYAALLPYTIIDTQTGDFGTALATVSVLSFLQYCQITVSYNYLTAITVPTYSQTFNFTIYLLSQLSLI